MKLNQLLCGAAMAGSLLFATNAFADASQEGLEVRFGLQVPIINQSVKTTFEGVTVTAEPDDVMAGISGQLSVGYRFGYVGVYLDQDLGGIWWTGDTKKVIDDGWFLGGTYITARGIFSLMDDSLEINAAFGIGMMYSDGDDADDLKDWDDEDWDDDDEVREYKPTLFTNADGKAVPCFAMKFGAAATYWLDEIGFGIHLDYNLGILTKSKDGVKTTQLFHSVNPGLHFRMQFDI